MEPTSVAWDPHPESAASTADARLLGRIESIERRLVNVSTRLEHVEREARRTPVDVSGAGDAGDLLPVVTARPGPAGGSLSSAGLALRILGPLELCFGGQVIELRRRGKAEAVLKALALSPNRRLSADTLADLVWPRLAPPEARHSLQTTISVIRRTLQQRERGLDPILRHGNAYALHPDVVTDVDLFDEHYRRALSLEGAGEIEQAVSSLSLALALFRDEPRVDEFTELNLIIERERISAIHLNILSRISAYYFRMRQWEESLLYASSLVARDPSREDAHRLIIRCFLNLGQRGQALRHYRLCCRAVREMFDAAPELATTQLYDEIANN
jgi:DNA-binding SARP family transcriptional activator